MEKNKWEEKKSIYSLPKVKSVRFKVKKEKAAADAQTPADQAAPAAAGAQPQATSATGAAAKPAAQKQAAPKDKKAKA